MTGHQSDGVLLVAHGTVETLDELPAFLAEIRRGKPPPPGLIEELRHRYSVIGGSPLLSLTHAQADALASELGLPVLVAMRLWKPRVEDVLEHSAAQSLSRLCVLPLAPFSVHVYNAAAERAFERARARLGHVPRPVYVENWGLSPGFIRAHAELISETLATLPSEVPLLLSAHSLPRAVIQAGDPYADLVQAAAEAIGKSLGRPVHLAYQSQGADGGDWLGPDLFEVLGELRRAGARKVVHAPFGFLADHVETLYDVDIEARRKADELGLEFHRVPSLNTHPGLIAAMADVVRRALA